MEVNPTGRSALVVVSNGQYWSQTYEEQLRKLGQSGKEETQGRPHHSPQVPDKRLQWRGIHLFSHKTRDRTPGSDTYLQQGSFRLDIRKNFSFTEGVIRHLNRMPRELVSPLEMFKRCVDTALWDTV